MEVVYHYTIKEHLDGIIRDGRIARARTGVPPGEKPVVWFSRNTVWEETANKMYLEKGEIVFGTKQSTHERSGGLARLGVYSKTAPHNWSSFMKLSGI